MFEYLMPQLVMPTYDGTLLDQTCRAAVARQIAYGRQRGVPWGISESGYNTVDASLNYQYHAFGVPGLGLTRGLADDLVVAPYASALGTDGRPRGGMREPAATGRAGLEGRFGFYEAVDYTPARLPRGQSSAIVRSFMAHHQGMNLLALAYLLLGRPMQRRFESDPLFQATLLLLQERIPKTAAVPCALAEHAEASAFSEPAGSVGAAAHRRRTRRLPRCNCCRTAAITSWSPTRAAATAAGGISRSRAGARTPPATTGASFCLPARRGDAANTGRPRTSRRSSGRTTTRRCSPRGAPNIRRRDLDYETYTEIVVSPEDDIELRRMRITNHARVRRTIEVTSYAEVVLASPAADALQPSFGNLFVQTEIVPARRRRSCARGGRDRADDPTPWMFHLMASHGVERRRRLRTRPIACGSSAAAARSRAPLALSRTRRLSGSRRLGAGARSSRSAAGSRSSREQSATLDVVSGAADTRDACLALVGKYQDRHLADRVFDLAWTHSGVMLRQINATRGRCADLRPPGGIRALCERGAARRRRRASCATSAGNPGFGATRSPATCRSCC